MKGSDWIALAIIVFVLGTTLSALVWLLIEVLA